MSPDNAIDCVGDRYISLKEVISIPFRNPTSDPSEVILSEPTIITPIAARRSQMNVLTPSPLNAFSPSVDEVRLCLEQARREAEHSARALKSLADGIRALKRIFEATSSVDKGSDRESISKDLHHIYQLADSLQGTLGPDFLALVNAAAMLRDHSQLAFQETSDVVADLRKAKVEAQCNAIAAACATKEAQTLSKTNGELKDQVRKLRQEKRILVKEIKAMREHAAEQRLVEQHVLKSLTVHELVLKTPPSVTMRKTYFNDDIRNAETAGAGQFIDAARDGVYSESTAEEESGLKRGKGFKRGFLAFRRNNKATKDDTDSLALPEGMQNDIKDKDDGLLRGFGTPTRHSPKSHLPGLDEISTFTDDSSAVRFLDKEVKGEEPYLEREGGPLRIVTNRHNVAQPSPLVSPDGIHVPEYKSLSDPHVLRTLMIPSCRDETKLHFLSPRKKITASLYEC